MPREVGGREKDGNARTAVFDYRGMFGPYRFALPLLALACATPACDLGPRDGAFISPSAVRFHGYVSDPHAPVRVYAQDKTTNLVRVVAEIDPSNTPRNFGGDVWYAFDSTVDLTDTSNWQCFFSASCPSTVPYGATARFDLVQIFSGQPNISLRTFDADADDCFADLMGNGVTDGWVLADVCRSDNSPFLYLRANGS